MMSLNVLRKHLALPKTSWQLCLLAMIGGTASAFLIILFMLTIEGIQHFYLSQRDNYTSLGSLSRFDLPIFGAFIILLFAWFTGYKYIRTGIPLVLHHLRVSHGVIPLRNTFNQFFGSAIALASGFSVGREGPAVHLGAACSSYIGSKLHLPFNSIRTLCACGIAAGIAASFNTPVAAVIFVMEVILREYKVHIFIPVMLAAIIGSMITHVFFGPAHEFEYFEKIQLTALHYPSIVVLGVVLGILAFAFNRYLVLIIKYSAKYHIIPRLLLAALITGGLAYFIPFTMGTDVSAVSFSLTENIGFQLLAGLLIAKILMTIFALGLGIPGGIVGPILGIGAVAGTCAATVASTYFPGEFVASDYALMGMAGFMAATLNAPLAALLTVVELSNQIEIIVPAMIIIASACISSGQFFKNRSIFVMQLEMQKLLYREPPIEKSLQRVGVIGVMQESFSLTSAEEQQVSQASESKSKLMIVERQTECSHFYWQENSQKPNEDKIIEHQLQPLNYQATLAEAYLLLVEQRCGGVYIYQKNINDIIGIITFEQIRRYLTEGKTSL